MSCEQIKKEISAVLSETFGYGVTHIDVKGYYKNSKQTIIYFAVNQFQIARMKSIIEDYDPPDTFVTITENSEFMGSNIKIRKKER